MISVDTNVVVRLLTKDDLEQFQYSLKLFQEKNIFICDTVILETEKIFGRCTIFISSLIKLK